MTANEADLVLSEFVTENASDVSGLGDGEWMVIAPFGDYLRPDRSAIQKFPREQGKKVLKTWNSLTGVAARYFNNIRHKLGFKSSCPIWDGHPDNDKARYPVERCLGEITELRVTANALEGRVKKDPTGWANRTPGPLFPSVLWWHFPPSGDPPAVFPELIESVGLVRTPNMAGVPAWTSNSALASPEAGSPTDGLNQKQNNMDRKKIALALGLAETASEADIDAALVTLRTTANSSSTLNTQITTANASLATITAERDRLTTDLTTANTALAGANSKVTILTTEKDGLLTEKTALTTANAALVEGTLLQGICFCARRTGNGQSGGRRRGVRGSG
jgi:hypothetical protein